MASNTIPEIPAAMADLPRHIANNPQTPLVEILEPYRKYEAHLRTVYAQDRQNPLLADPHLNVVPLFTNDTNLITTRARDLAAESEQEKSRYIMALPEDKRRPHGSPAVVPDVEAFRKNFNIFSESSLADLNWDNVVAAGSSVVNCLLPVPKDFDTTKRKLREYYHEKFCPASDVDLFLYGLTHEEAIEKIKQIEKAVKDAILSEVTVVRTKYAITIASQYPVRHIQIVLRVYKSISEILTGFDIDAAGGAYNGQQVYVTPRALGSFITQINHIDLSRRSPSYENRLSKYSHRNFEVYWPDLDRSRIDPTIFERSFQRTLGLARLLILEALPTSSAREQYLNKRREERGRPQVYRGFFGMHGNIKEAHEDEVADWLSQEEVSNYHTFSVPYGQKFNAKRIEKLCYTRDLLLNAEWNQSDKRDVYLHRHPAFFGRVEDVIMDCCGSCPVPKTTEEKEVAEKEAEIYISGEVSFLIDDPGRQQIGSFNPLTDADWTDMAYVGNTARLCQSIVNEDVDDVRNWLSQDEADPNTRDYTGRTPLHLACTTSSAEVVKALIDTGARLTARLADGRTALHLAAARGHVEIIKLLMDKSEANEEAEEENKDQKRRAARADDDDSMKDIETDEDDDAEGSENLSDTELLDDAETDDEGYSMATGSFVKVKNGETTETDNIVPEESEDEPDFYNIDVLAWDVPCSPLHLAITHGQEGAVETLCEYGADAILPVKFLKQETDRYTTEEAAAILSLCLALTLPREQAKSMAKLLLKLGATASQADSKGETAFHRFVAKADIEVLDALWEDDKAGVQNAINHLFCRGHYYSAEIDGPVHAAISRADPILLLKLLDSGAEAQIGFETWLKAVKVSPSASARLGDLEQNKKRFAETLEQPLMTAVREAKADLALQLIERGADPNAMTTETATLIQNPTHSYWKQGKFCLDVVQDLIEDLQTLKERPDDKITEPRLPSGMQGLLANMKPGSYKHWLVERDVAHEKRTFERRSKEHQKNTAHHKQTHGLRIQAIEEALNRLQSVKAALQDAGGKTFKEAYPDIKCSEDTNRLRHQRNHYSSNKDSYDFTFKFQGDVDMTETKRHGYIDLMEAAWSGDIEKVKSLTTQAWGIANEQPPLKMAIWDANNNTPFSLAFLRGHTALAKAILEIIAAQWSPLDEDKLRYKVSGLRIDDEDGASESCGESDDSDAEVRIVSEKVNENFTIDDIGAISMQVKSHERPLQTLTYSYSTFHMSCGKLNSTGRRDLFQHCLDKDDLAGLKSLLELAQTAQALQSSMPSTESDEESRLTIPVNTFEWAVREGKTRLLSVIIKATGAGIPLDHLVKKSGVAVKQKPRFYQGLTVYGKKRKDWANAGRGMVTRTSGTQAPPLLTAALGGSMDSVEFFLSDSPHRIYVEFGKSSAAKDDGRLKHLKDSPGGFDRAISRWLSADNDLVIHCAVMARTSQEASEVLDYLVQTCPSFLEKKNTNGDTPLMVAYRFGRLNFAKILIAANADQSTRNNKGENLLHALFDKSHAAKTEHVEEMLELMDADLRTHLFMQRKNIQDGGETPLHAWVTAICGGQTRVFGSRRYHYYHYDHNQQHVGTPKRVAAVMQTVLKYSKGAELSVLNSAGDTPLHTVIMKNHVALVKVIIDHQPNLLHRENAVGRTPLEIALDRLTAEKLKRPVDRNYYHNKVVIQAEQLIKRHQDNIQQASKEDEHDPEYVNKTCREIGLRGEYTTLDFRGICGSFGIHKGEHNERIDKNKLNAVMWDFCESAAAKNPDTTRRLVSLNEANDVAKRLGEQFVNSRYFNTNSRAEDDAEDNEDEEEKAEKEKAKKDFTVGLYHSTHAWYPSTKEEKEENEEKEGEISVSGTLCQGCGQWHE